MARPSWCGMVAVLPQTGVPLVTAYRAARAGVLAAPPSDHRLRARVVAATPTARSFRLIGITGRHHSRGASRSGSTSRQMAMRISHSVPPRDIEE
jgi:hypothetical protein